MRLDELVERGVSKRRQPIYKLAVGIQYNDHKDAVPFVGLKGELALADEVVRLAKRYNIPVMEDGSLARTMDALEIDEEIPESLYKAVAIVLNAADTQLKGRKALKSTSIKHSPAFEQTRYDGYRGHRWPCK